MLPSSIINDNTSGSSALVIKIVEWVSEELKSGDYQTQKEIADALDELLSAFPHFAALQHFVREFQQFLKTELTGLDPTKKLKTFTSVYQRTWKANQETAAANMISAIDFNGKTVFIHSHSKSLIILFELLKKKKIKPHIIQTVSEPAKEGVIQAEQLAAMGFSVTLINESAAGRFINNADMLVTGADALFPNYVVNKTGTMPLALLFKYFQKPCFILADSRKRVKTNNKEHDLLTSFGEKEKPANEIIQTIHKNIRPVNYYFEPVPRKLFTAIFTEETK